MLLIVLGVTDAVPRAPTGTIEQRKGVELGGVYKTRGPLTTKPTIDPTVGPAYQPEVQRELTAAILCEIEQSHLQTREIVKFSCDYCCCSDLHLHDL